MKKIDQQTTPQHCYCVLIGNGSGQFVERCKSCDKVSMSAPLAATIALAQLHSRRRRLKISRQKQCSETMSKKAGEQLGPVILLSLLVPGHQLNQPIANCCSLPLSKYYVNGND